MFTHLKTISSNHNPFEGIKVCIVGDLMVDQFIYGDVERISPEAPIPVVRVTNSKKTLGGAANVAVNLSSVGGRPILIGLIGDDENGRILQDISQENGIDTSGVLFGENRPTTSKKRVIGRGQQVVRIDEEVTTPLTTSEREKILFQLRKARKSTDFVIVSDYAKGAIDQDLLNEIKQIWDGKTIMIDPKPSGGVDYTGVTCMTPNLEEAAKLLGHSSIARTNEEAENVVSELLKKFVMKSVLLTRAGDGMTFNNNGKITHYPVKKLEVRDVSGAGDTVISIITAGLAAGLEEDAVLLANEAGSIVVSKSGTASTTWEEISKHMEESGKYPPFMFR